MLLEAFDREGGWQGEGINSCAHWLKNGDGEPLSVGRKTRSKPPAIRRALRRRDGGFRFTDPNGTLLPNAPDGRSRGNVEEIRSANTADGLQITARTAVPDWGGERMDHQLAVLELIQRE